MNIWLWFFCGGLILALVGFIVSQAVYQRSWETLFDMLCGAGFFLTLVGLIGIIVSGIVSENQPTVVGVRVDRVEYIERDAEQKLGLLVVNFLDAQGHMLPQFRQFPAPEALATLLHTLVDKSQLRIVVTYQSGGDTGYRITRVDVWHSRLDPPEVYEF